MIMKLYEIPEQYRQALESIDVDEETGEIVNADALNQFEMDAKEKIENAALFVRELERESQAISEEAERMRNRAKAVERKAERIKSLILTALQPFDGRVKTQRITVYERHTDVVKIVEGSTLPDAYVTKKVTLSPNKTELKRAIKAGATIDGVTLEDSVSVVMR